MALLPLTYSGLYANGPIAAGTQFSLVTAGGLPIQYLERSHIEVAYTANSLALDPTWTVITSWTFDSSGGAITLNAGLSSGSVLRIRRTTPSDGPYQTFSGSSYLTNEQLNVSDQYLLYIVQEWREAASYSLATSLEALNTANGALQRSGGTMTGPLLLAASTDPNAAVSKSYVDQLFFTGDSPITNGEYILVNNVAGLPANPVVGDRVQVRDSTGAQNTASITGLPTGFVGDSGYTILLYRTATSWLFVMGVPNDPDRRYNRREAFRNSRKLYISKSIYASDSNDGTSPAEPLLTWAGAWAKHDAGDVIEAAPGTYVESGFPYRWKRDVVTIGNDLRAVTIRPAAGTENQSMFKVDSGFKAWGITFAGHQANSVEQSWAISFDELADNRTIGAVGLGAYIVKSPYIQNCSCYTAEDDSGEGGSVSTGNTGGGILVDGSMCAVNSPLRSMVVDSYTQVNLGGPGCLVRNDGYAQLVSFFSTFCTYHVRTETGGQVNLSGGGTTDFGVRGLVANGYSSTPLYTGRARVAGYGKARVERAVTINLDTDVFSSATAHTLINTDQVTISATTGTLPSPLQAGTIYYVVNYTTNTFQLALTSGGAAINMTGTGTAAGTFSIVSQGVLELDVVNFTANRAGRHIAYPLAGQAGSTGNPRSIEAVNGSSFRLALQAMSGAVRPIVHEYVGGGTATIGGTQYSVTAATYDNATGQTWVTASGYTPAIGASVQLAGLVFRCNSGSRPNAGQLMFPRVAYPTSSGPYAYTKTGANTFTYTTTTSTTKHEYVEGGSVLIGGVEYGVQACTYNEVTGLVTITTKTNLPAAATGSATVSGLQFICPNSAYIVTASLPIDANGSIVTLNTDPDTGLSIQGSNPNQAGWRVLFYNSVNGGLKNTVAANAILDFRNRSQISAPGHTFEYAGSGTNYNALPGNGGVPIPANQIVEENNGRVYSSNTNEKGDFAVGTAFTVDGTTGEVTISTSRFNLSGLNAIGPFSRNGGLSTVGVQLKEVSNDINLFASTGEADGNTAPTQFAVKAFLGSNYVPLANARIASIGSVNMDQVGAVTNVIDLGVANYFLATLTANRTFSIVGEPANVGTFTLLLTITTGTPTFPSSFRWPFNLTPTWTAGRAYEIICTRTLYSGATRWLASAIEYTLT